MISADDEDLTSSLMFSVLIYFLPFAQFFFPSLNPSEPHNGFFFPLRLLRCLQFFLSDGGPSMMGSIHTTLLHFYLDFALVAHC